MRNLILALSIILLTGCSNSLGRMVQSKIITDAYQKVNPNASSLRNQYRFEKGKGNCNRLQNFCKGEHGRFSVHPKPEYWCECTY